MLDGKEKIGVIGAGPSGLAAAKAFKHSRLAFDVLDRGQRVGGIWDWHNPDSPMYRSAHLISSKTLTEFKDFPMPAAYPDYPGRFDGTVIHSSQYDTPDLFEGQRVLVVGAGNSGCDIATESALMAKRTCLSLRRGYYVIPKYFCGRPADAFGEVSVRLGLPLTLRRQLNTGLLNTFVGIKSQENEHQSNHKNHPENAAGVIAPPSAIRPSRNRTDQQQNQDDEKQCFQGHRFLPLE